MKKTSLLLAVSLCTASPALAVDTHASWQGFFNVTGTTAGCAGIGGTSVSDTNVSVYRPALTASELTSMSIIFTKAAVNYQTQSESTNPQMRGTGPVNGVAMNGKGKPFGFQTTVSNVVTVPATVASTTGNVTITGTINNMWSVSGCNVTFKATYSKAP